MLLLGGLLPLEAKAELSRVLLDPAALSLHQTNDEAEHSVAPARPRCHRPTRAARLLEQAPAPAGAAALPGAALRRPSLSRTAALGRARRAPPSLALLRLYAGRAPPR